jgi:hypothetical protein
LRDTGNGGAGVGAKSWRRQLQKIPRNGLEIARHVEGHIHVVLIKELRSRDRRRAAQVDPVVEPGKRRGVVGVRGREIGALQIVGLRQLL